MSNFRGFLRHVPIVIGALRVISIGPGSTMLVALDQWRAGADDLERVDAIIVLAGAPGLILSATQLLEETCWSIMARLSSSCGRSAW